MCILSKDYIPSKTGVFFHKEFITGKRHCIYTNTINTFLEVGKKGIMLLPFYVSKKMEDFRLSDCSDNAELKQYRKDVDFQIEFPHMYYDECDAEVVTTITRRQVGKFECVTIAATQGNVASIEAEFGDINQPYFDILLDESKFPDRRPHDMEWRFVLAAFKPDQSEEDYFLYVGYDVPPFADGVDFIPTLHEHAGSDLKDYDLFVALSFEEPYKGVLVDVDNLYQSFGFLKNQVYSLIPDRYDEKYTTLYLGVPAHAPIKKLPPIEYRRLFYSLDNSGSMLNGSMLDPLVIVDVKDFMDQKGKALHKDIDLTIGDLKLPFRPKVFLSMKTDHACLPNAMLRV